MSSPWRYELCDEVAWYSASLYPTLSIGHSLFRLVLPPAHSYYPPFSYRLSDPLCFQVPAIAVYPHVVATTAATDRAAHTVAFTSHAATAVTITVHAVAFVIVYASTAFIICGATAVAVTSYTAAATLTAARAATVITVTASTVATIAAAVHVVHASSAHGAHVVCASSARKFPAPSCPLVSAKPPCATPFSLRHPRRCHRLAPQLSSSRFQERSVLFL